MKKTIVSRKRWNRGNLESALLLPDKTMCCLGFRAIQVLHCTEEQIKGVKNPAGIDGYGKQLDCLYNPLSELGNKCTKEANEAMIVNDSPYMSDELRESRLKEIFKSFGEEIEFID